MLGHAEQFQPCQAYLRLKGLQGGALVELVHGSLAQQERPHRLPLLPPALHRGQAYVPAAQGRAMRA